MTCVCYLRGLDPGSFAAVLMADAVAQFTGLGLSSFPVAFLLGDWCATWMTWPELFPCRPSIIPVALLAENRLLLARLSPNRVRRTAQPEPVPPIGSGWSSSVERLSQVQFHRTVHVDGRICSNSANRESAWVRFERPGPRW